MNKSLVCADAGILVKLVVAEEDSSAEWDLVCGREALSAEGGTGACFLARDGV